MRQVVIFLVALACSIPTLHCMPLGSPAQTQTLFIGPDNVEALASYLDDSLVVDERVIKFGSGSSAEKLLEVPLVIVAPHATIRVTVGLDDEAPSAPAVDHDPIIGISDGSAFNGYYITDVSNYGSNHPSGDPCYPLDYASQDDRHVTERTHAPAQATMIFRPLRKYGACYLPLDGGYVNTATFNNQLDTSHVLSLSVRRNDQNEQYRFHYFIVEIF